jgi:hypothetical protein
MLYKASVRNLVGEKPCATDVTSAHAPRSVAAHTCRGVVPPSPSENHVRLFCQQCLFKKKTSNACFGCWPVAAAWNANPSPPPQRPRRGHVNGRRFLAAEKAWPMVCDVGYGKKIDMWRHRFECRKWKIYGGCWSTNVFLRGFILENG